MHGELTEEIEKLIIPLIEAESCELVELNVKQSVDITKIDIFADRPNGGIMIDQCTHINKIIVHALEENQWFGEDFIVQVSSPGLDRDLKTQKDFSRAMGRKIRVHLNEAVEGKVEHHGKINKVNDDHVVIETKDQLIAIPLNIISKAVQIIE